MLRYGILAGALAALFTLAHPAPAKAQWFCSGQIGSGICGAGIGGGIGAAFGAAGTGAVIGGVLGLAGPPPWGFGGRRYSCNYNACAASYRSFRGSDCSFQPYQGPRRYCRR